MRSFLEVFIEIEITFMKVPFKFETELDKNLLFIVYVVFNKPILIGILKLSSISIL